MSEKLHHGIEFNVEHSEETARENSEHLRHIAEQERTKHGSAEHLSEIQKKVEAHAISGKEAAPSENEQPKTSHHRVSRDIKELTFNRSLVRVRKRLKTPEKALSAIIHQPAIDKVSEVTAKTIARPSGLFGGGLFALAGTSLLLYLTRKYGYEFNYLVFLMLFVLGFLVGSLVEISIKVILRRRADQS